MRLLAPLALLASLALTCPAQQIKLNLDSLASKASNKVDLSLTGQTLQFAARFLEDGDEDQAKIKKLISGLQGIYLRSYAFSKDNAITAADVDSVRSQLKTPDWSRIVGVESAGEGQSAEVHIRSESNKITGLAILVVGAREFTIVNIVGPVDLDSLAELSGHFGVPKLVNKAAPAKSGPRKEE